MNQDISPKENKERGQKTILVAVDFSHCSRLALRKAKDLLGSSKGHIVVLHVIDSDFISRCIRHRLGDEANIKEELFKQGKQKLQAFVRKERVDGLRLETLVCEGVPFMEVNRKANEIDAEMIVIGSRGHGDDMNNIFFGSTSEKILRFITRPILCVPPKTEYHTSSIM